VVELTQGCAGTHMLLLEASHLPLQDGLRVHPAVCVEAVCPGKKTCSAHMVGVTLGLSLVLHTQLC
jgi:hypothetical protein